MQKIYTMNVLQQGLIWGAILGTFHLITKLISPFTDTNLFSGYIFGSIILTINVVAYVFIGLRASQVTGRAGTGALVGFLTAIFSSIIGLIGTIIRIWTNADELRQKIQDLANQLHLDGHSLSIILLLILATAITGGFIIVPGFGALAGAIGGAIGKQRAKNAGLPEY